MLTKIITRCTFDLSVVELVVLSFKTMKQVAANTPRASLYSNLLQIWAIFGYSYGMSSFVGISPVVSAAFFLSFCLLGKQKQRTTNWIFAKMSFVSNFVAEFILDELFELLATKIVQILIPLEKKTLSLSLGSMATRISKEDKKLLQDHLTALNEVLSKEKESRTSYPKSPRVRGLYAGAAAHAAATSGLADDVGHDDDQAPDISFTLEQLREFYRKYIPQQVHIQLLVFRSSTEYKFV